MKENALFAIFVAAWMLCGCTLETIFESPSNSAITVLAAVVAIAVAAAIFGGRKE